MIILKQNLFMLYILGCLDTFFVLWLVEHFVQDTESRWATACHESGHILVAHYTQAAKPAIKVTLGNARILL